MVFIQPMRRWILTTAFVFLIASAVGNAEVQPAPPKKVEPPGQEVPLLGNTHIQKPTDPHVPYNSVPPTSGPHLHHIANWGVSKTPIANELQVHNLEDGGVMIQYNCKNCDAMIAQLEKFAAKYKRVIVAPYPAMKTPIALTAWGRIDTLDTLDEARIERFVQAYMGIDHHPRE